MNIGQISAETAAAPDKAVLVAGPTASGKSSLALRLAEDQGRAIVNADALQVFENWRILTARPPVEDEMRAPHALYGHVAGDAEYSVGAWLRQVQPLLSARPAPVIVGGTGLYFTALTQGLADIPQTPPSIRGHAMARLSAGGLDDMVAELDLKTRARIDLRNPMRVQRAWEVLQATGRGLAEWQDNTPPPLLPLRRALPLLIDAPKDWLTPRIEARFDLMLEWGALDEAQRNAPTWSPDHASAKAIGAAELIAHVKGELPLDTAREATIIATRQYAKRQRSWFRARMTGWRQVSAQDL